MSDEDLRAMARSVGGDPVAAYRLRVAQVRAGRPTDAGLAEGDVVLVEEVEGLWIKAPQPWRGRICLVFRAGDLYVKPIEVEIAYWIQPSEEYISTGLYLAGNDRVTLSEPNPEAVDVVYHEIDRDGWRSDVDGKIKKGTSTPALERKHEQLNPGNSNDHERPK